MFFAVTATKLAIKVYNDIPRPLPKYLNDSLGEAIESTTNQYPDLQKQFNSALIEAMQMVNKNSRNGTGVWYFDDYAKYCSQNNKILNQGLKNGFADNEFWEITG